jgi:hypothetical protein
MKIAKIISIIKSFTNFPLPFQACILPHSGSFLPLCGVLHPICLGAEFGVSAPGRLGLGPVLARGSPPGACPWGLGFSSLAPLSGGAGLGSLSSTAEGHLGSGGMAGSNFCKNYCPSKLGLAWRRREDSASKTELLRDFFQGKSYKKPFLDRNGQGGGIISADIACRCSERPDFWSHD